MSHFTVGILVVPAKATTRVALVAELDRLLAPFDEDRAVEPYTDSDGEETTYNPSSKWDWWTIGGRWSDIFGGRPIIPVRDLPPLREEDGAQHAHTFALVAPEGVWHEKGRMGWFGFSTSPEEAAGERTAATAQATATRWARQSTEVLSAYPDHLLVVVDCHI